MSNVVEVKARGAEVLALTTEDFREKMEKTADATVSVPVTIHAPALSGRGAPAAVRLLYGRPARL